MTKMLGICGGFSGSSSWRQWRGTVIHHNATISLCILVEINVSSSKI